MPLEIDSSLAAHLEGAYRVVEVVALRTRHGAVYTVELGETLLESGPSHGGKVTQVAPIKRHLGIVDGTSHRETFAAAQRLILRALSAPAPHAPLNAPHTVTETAVSL